MKTVCCPEISFITSKSRSKSKIVVIFTFFTLSCLNKLLLMIYCMIHVYCTINRDALDKIIDHRREGSGAILTRINVFCFFCSKYAFYELKDHPLFRIIRFYVLSLNDKLRDYSILTVMEEFGKNKEKWE
jgi:hypothetical protein